MTSLNWSTARYLYGAAGEPVGSDRCLCPIPRNIKQQERVITDANGFGFRLDELSLPPIPEREEGCSIQDRLSKGIMDISELIEYKPRMALKDIAEHFCVPDIELITDAHLYAAGGAGFNRCSDEQRKIRLALGGRPGTCRGVVHGNRALQHS